MLKVCCHQREVSLEKEFIKAIQALTDEQLELLLEAIVNDHLLRLSPCPTNPSDGLAIESETL